MRAFLILLGTIVALVVVVLVGFRPVGVYQMPGVSMSPMLRKGDYILINHTAYGLKLPWSEERIQPKPIQKGDIISFRDPVANQGQYVKRVVALPGEEVYLRGSEIWIEGEMLPNTSPPAEDALQMQEQVIIVPEKTVFVLGDNRNHSKDSRTFGPIQMSAVTGRYSQVIYNEQKGFKLQWNPKPQEPVK